MAGIVINRAQQTAKCLRAQEMQHDALLRGTSARRSDVPAAEIKMRREHRVPLSRQAIEIIRSMGHVADYSEYVFPSFNPEKPLSENAVSGALKRSGYEGRMNSMRSNGATAKHLEIAMPPIDPQLGASTREHERAATVMNAVFF